jgi:hypothetical protein
MTTPKQPNKSSAGSARNVLRAHGMGAPSGHASSLNSGPASGKSIHSPTNPNAMQAAKPRNQNTKTNTIQARKAPGA